MIVPNGLDELSAAPVGAERLSGVTTSYTADVVNEYGCAGTSEGVATVNVETYARPEASISGLPQSVTASSTASASVPATSGATYAWDVTGGVIISGQSGRAITVRAGCSGSTTVRVTVTRDCGTTALYRVRALKAGTSSHRAASMGPRGWFCQRFSSGRFDEGNAIPVSQLCVARAVTECSPSHQHA